MGRATRRQSDLEADDDTQQYDDIVPAAPMTKDREEEREKILKDQKETD